MIVLLALIVLALFLAASVLPQKRDLDDRDRRGWWPGSPRRP
jgi:hypothetical protein